MTIKEQIDADLKVAMLAGDKVLATTLRGLKSAILYAEVADGSRDSGGVSDAAIIALFAKEAKKRQESADLFAQGGNSEKSQAELVEKEVIAKYLPAQISDEELAQIVDTVVSPLGDVGKDQMGRIIGLVKAEVGVGADGGRIAKAVSERIR